MFNKHGIVLDGYVDTATDALRLAAELSSVELSAKHIQFKKFNNKEIHLIFSYLEKLNYTFDDMWLYRKPWKKFYKGIVLVKQNILKFKSSLMLFLTRKFMVLKQQLEVQFSSLT